MTGERPHCDQPVASRMGRASGLEGFEKQIQGLRSADAAQALEAALTIFRSLAAQQGLRVERRAVEALERYLPDWQIATRPKGGLSVWVRLPRGSSEEAVVRAANDANVQLMPGAPWFPGEPPAPHVRLSFAAAPEARLTEAIRLLAAATCES